jgi:putative ABC transport system substrate-binding protein
MRRREFLSALGVGTASWIFDARAQTANRRPVAQQAERVRRIGVLMTNIESDPQGQERTAALREGLRELGWTDASNLQILLRWSGGDVVRIREYSAELVHLASDLIVANGTPVVAALRRATQSIPIVFVVVNDPVAQGIVSSLCPPWRQYHGLQLSGLLGG